MRLVKLPATWADVTSSSNDRGWAANWNGAFTPASTSDEAIRQPQLAPATTADAMSGFERQGWANRRRRNSMVRTECANGSASKRQRRGIQRPTAGKLVGGSRRTPRRTADSPTGVRAINEKRTTSRQGPGTSRTQGKPASSHRVGPRTSPSLRISKGTIASSAALPRCLATWRARPIRPS